MSCSVQRCGCFRYSQYQCWDCGYHFCSNCIVKCGGCPRIQCIECSNDVHISFTEYSQLLNEMEEKYREAYFCYECNRWKDPELSLSNLGLKLIIHESEEGKVTSEVVDRDACNASPFPSPPSTPSPSDLLLDLELQPRLPTPEESLFS